MREVKFQAWQKQRKELFEVSAIQFASPTRPGFVVKKALSGGLNIETWTLDEVELREFTGLMDKHGKEIYEGDIVEYMDNTSQGLVKKVAVIEDIRYLPSFVCSKWEKIIGNVHEHPDLVRQEEERNNNER